MKTKFLFSAIAALLCWSCTSEDPTPFGKSVSQDVPTSRFISPDEACEIASQSMKDMGFSSASRSGSEATAYLYNPSGLSRGEASDSLFYVVNFDEGGFALVLAERDATVNPIVISETGTFEDNDNPVAQDYILALADSVSGTNSNDSIRKRDGSLLDGLKPDPPLRPANPDPNPWMVDDEGYQVTTFTTTYTYENFLTVAWEQKNPYNIYCDALSQSELNKIIGTDAETEYNGRGCVGCDAVAIGQICSYYKRPAEIGGRTLNWDVLSSFQTIHHLTAPYKDDLAYMLARIGKIMGVKHGIVTEATASKVKDCLVGFGYTEAKFTSDVNECYTSLKDGQVVYVRGNGTTGKGHSWVADAYKRVVKEHVRFEKGSTTNYQVMRTEVLHYLAFNWGMGKGDHVYYLVGEPYDTGETNSDGKPVIYNSSFGYIVNIK